MIVEDFLRPSGEKSMAEETPILRNILISYFPDGQVCVAFPPTQTPDSIIEVLQASIKAMENYSAPVMH